ncbi:MAG: sugar transferase, partial [Actinomycetota bacterium]|nr:sugar transferase [Actinomycetota bacterium]
MSTQPSNGAVTTWWESRYRKAVLVTDLVIIAVCLRIGLVLTDGSLAGHLPGALAGMTAVVLLGSFFACRAWERRVLGQGAEEFRRLVNAVVTAAVVLGLTALAMDVGFFRPWVFAVIPATGLCLLTSRYALRRVLHARRSRGLCMHPVLAAGSRDEVADLIDRTRRESHYGWMITGVCMPGAAATNESREVRGVPVVGELSDVPELVRQGDYRVVAVVPDAHWTRLRLRNLAWELEGAPAELVVAP